MSDVTQKPWPKILVLVLFVSALMGLTLFSTNIAGAAQSGNGTADEILVYNRGTNSNPFIITKTMGGFIKDKPPTGAANANWETGQYAGFSGGTLYYRARIIDIPVSQPKMKFGFCFWSRTAEQCRGQQFNGVPGSEMTWSHALNDMWKKGGKSIDWANSRTMDAIVVRNSRNDPVSPKKGWNWNGENPDHWYPMKVHFTVVLLKAGGTFDGWGNYGW